MSADSGAEVDTIGPQHLKKLGLDEQNLLRSSVGLYCANDSKVVCQRTSLKSGDLTREMEMLPKIKSLQNPVMKQGGWMTRPSMTRLLSDLYTRLITQKFPTIVPLYRVDKQSARQ